MLAKRKSVAVRRCLPPEKHSLFRIALVHIFKMTPLLMPIQKADISAVRISFVHMIGTLCPISETIRINPPAVRILNYRVYDEFHSRVMPDLCRCLNKLFLRIRNSAARLTCGEDVSATGLGFHEIAVANHSPVLLSFGITCWFRCFDSGTEEITEFALSPVVVFAGVNMIGRTTEYLLPPAVVDNRVGSEI